jgi:hypothetical protein
MYNRQKYIENDHGLKYNRYKLAIETLPKNKLINGPAIIKKKHQVKNHVNGYNWFKLCTFHQSLNYCKLPHNIEQRDAFESGYTIKNPPMRRDLYSYTSKR